MALPAFARLLLLVTACVALLAGGAGAVDVSAALFGSYRAGGWVVGSQTWLDSSGNGRHAVAAAVQNSTVAAVVQAINAPAGQRGAGKAMTYLAGSKGAALTFGADPLPANFTICSVTRIPEVVGDAAALPAGVYGAAASGNRVLASTSSLWAHGHERGLAGVAYYNQAAYKTGGGATANDVWAWANPGDWLWMCASNEGAAADPASPCTVYIQGSTVVDGELACQLRGGSAAGVLAINAQSANSGADARHAPGMWAVAEVALWARWLSAAELNSVLLDMQQRYGFAANIAAPPSLRPPAPVQLIVVGTQESNSAFVSVLAIGLASFAAIVVLLARTTAMRVGSRRRARTAAELLKRFNYDVFLSYRRVDFAIVDGIADKLNLESLRVFIDRAGSMAGRPFDRELFRAISTSACFTPIITLRAMTVLGTVSATQLDLTLVEYIIALHFSLTGQFKLIYPIVIGEEIRDDTSARPRWDVLWENPAFKAARDALPNLVPTASLELAEAVLRAELGPDTALCPPLRNATIRQMMYARDDDGGFTGLLMHDACTLTGLQEDAELYIRHRFASNMKSNVAQQAQQAALATRNSGGQRYETVVSV